MKLLLGRVSGFPLESWPPGADELVNHCRVLIVSDHPLFAEGVVRLLGDQAGLQVVGVLSAEEAVVNIAQLTTRMS